MTRHDLAAGRAEGALEARILDLLMEMLPRGQRRAVQVDGNTALSDLGISSMAKISLAFRVEQTFGVDLSNMGEAMADARTVGDVIRLLHDAGVNGAQ